MLKKFFYIFIVIGLIIFCQQNISFIKSKLPFFTSKQISSEEKIKDFHKRYNETRIASINKRRSDEEQKKHIIDFDFSKILLLLDEVSGIIKQGPLLNPIQYPGKKHLFWLKEELEKEESLFSQFLSTERNNKSSKPSFRKKSWQFYLRAIKSSIMKIKGMISKTSFFHNNKKIRFLS